MKTDAGRAAEARIKKTGDKSRPFQVGKRYSLIKLAIQATIGKIYACLDAIDEKPFF